MPATRIITSEARIQANRLNAQRSTGPKTAEGKARSRANAVKHGLTGAGVALPNEDAAEVEARFEAIREELAPQTVLGAFLAHQVALMTVRCQRAARHETAILAKKVRGASSDFDEARNSEADHQIGWIASDPVSYRRKLMATPEGVDRLIDGLLGLGSDLDREGVVPWNYIHGHKVEAFFGRRSDDIPRSRGIILSNAIQGNFQEIDPAEVAHLSTLPEKRNWACDQMTVYINAEVERLRAHRATLDVEAITLDRSGSRNRAQFDSGQEAILARRYESAATRELYRALHELRAVEAADAGDQNATGDAEAAEAESGGASLVEANGESTPGASNDIEPNQQADHGLGAPLGSFGEAVSGSSGPLDRPDDPVAPLPSTRLDGALPAGNLTGKVREGESPTTRQGV